MANHGMKTSLAHIPLYKQKEIFAILEVIQSQSKKITKVEMIILFGSYARGDFVEKDITTKGHITYSYISDFDMLVVTKKPIYELNARLSSAIESNLNKESTIQTPVSIHVEDIHHVNAKLEKDHYFYKDIKREGIMLYDS